MYDFAFWNSHNGVWHSTVYVFLQIEDTNVLKITYPY